MVSTNDYIADVNCFHKPTGLCVLILESIYLRDLNGLRFSILWIMVFTQAAKTSISSLGMIDPIPPPYFFDYNDTCDNDPIDDIDSEKSAWEQPKARDITVRGFTLGVNFEF